MTGWSGLLASRYNIHHHAGRTDEAAEDIRDGGWRPPDPAASGNRGLVGLIRLL